MIFAWPYHLEWTWHLPHRDFYTGPRCELVLILFNKENYYYYYYYYINGEFFWKIRSKWVKTVLFLYPWIPMRKEGVVFVITSVSWWHVCNVQSHTGFYLWLKKIRLYMWIWIRRKNSYKNALDGVKKSPFLSIVTNDQK
jgi:hypothetical protein